MLTFLPDFVYRESQPLSLPDKLSKEKEERKAFWKQCTARFALSGIDIQTPCFSLSLTPDKGKLLTGFDFPSTDSQGFQKQKRTVC